MVAATNLKEHMDNFKRWIKTDMAKARSWEEERQQRLTWYRMKLSKGHIEKLTKNEFAHLIKNLWASNIFKNKDYKVSKLIQDNGLEKFRSSLNDLFYGRTSIDKRWDTFRATIKGIGPSSLSEILTFFDPQEYALVNLKPYRVLPLLGLKIDPVKDGLSYCIAVEQIGKIKNELERSGLSDVDFVLTDFFIAYLFYEVFDLQRKQHEQQLLIPKESKGLVESTQSIPAELGPKIESHEAAEAMLLMLGKILGYDTYTPDSGHSYGGKKLGEFATLQELPAFTSDKIMDSVENIDVIWMKDEWPEYFFEVEHTTGVTSGLLRIYQANKINSRFFIIGPKDVLKRFGREIEKAPFCTIKDKYHFHSYEDLLEMFLAAQNYRKVMDKFLI